MYCKKYSSTVLALTCKELDFYLSLFNNREISIKVKKALKYKNTIGANNSIVAIHFGLCRQSIDAAENKIIDRFKKVTEFYGI